jgi:hypothetical protein
MKTGTYFGILMMMVGLSTIANAQQGTRKQQPDAQQQKKLQHGHYRKALGVDSIKAAQVLQVQDSYKAALKALMADTSVNLEGRRAKVKALIEAKNHKLGQLLTPAQQQKLIPTTERVPAGTKQ